MRPTLLVLRTGFEPAISSVKGRRPEPLDHRSDEPLFWFIGAPLGKVIRTVGHPIAGKEAQTQHQVTRQKGKKMATSVEKPPFYSCREPYLLMTSAPTVTLAGASLDACSAALAASSIFFFSVSACTFFTTASDFFCAELI